MSENTVREAFEKAYAAIPAITPTKETAWLIWTASRKQAMEEAAKHLEQIAGVVSGPHESDGHYALLNRCAAAIRQQAIPLEK